MEETDDLIRCMRIFYTCFDSKSDRNFLRNASHQSESRPVSIPTWEHRCRTLQTPPCLRGYLISRAFDSCPDIGIIWVVWVILVVRGIRIIRVKTRLLGITEL